VVTLRRTYRADRADTGWYVRLARDPDTDAAVDQFAPSVLVWMVNPPVLYPVFSPPSPACLTTNDDTFRVEPRSTWRNAGDADEQNLLLFCRLPSTAFAGSSPPAHAADPVAHHREEAQLAVLRVAREHGERVVVESRDVDVGAVRRNSDVAWLIESVDSARVIADEAGGPKRAGVGIAREDRHGVRAAARHIELRAVGRDRDRGRLVDPGDARCAIAHCIGEHERPARRGAAARDRRHQHGNRAPPIRPHRAHTLSQANASAGEID